MDNALVWEPYECTQHECTQIVPLGIYGYQNLRNFSHDMLSCQATVKSYEAQVYRYSPNVTKFPIYSHYIPNAHIQSWNLCVIMKNYLLQNGNHKEKFLCI